MIGNDIIDLNIAAIESNWCRKGFLHKVFTEEEQAVILSSDHPFHLVWQFWSMKESAYKVYVQSHQKRFFAPKKLKCVLLSKTDGIVTINGEYYYTISKISNNFIFTEAILSKSSDLVNDCVELKNIAHTYQSKQLYEKLKTAISKKRKLPMNQLKVKKNALGIPKLYQNDTQLEVSFSLSHHGMYGAYSFINEL